MSLEPDPTYETVEEHFCVNHPAVSTVVSCGKCASYLCPRCMVFTPVGVRCRSCAQLRRPAQFDVAPGRLALAGLASLLVATICWYFALDISFALWFIAIFIGLAVGETASRVVRRRVSRPLEVVVAAAIFVGYLVASGLLILSLAQGRFGSIVLKSLGWAGYTQIVFQALSLLSVAVAVVFAVGRLRR